MNEKLSHYTILEEIGRGESQIVYRALDDKLNREVALKVLPKVLVQDPEKRRRFVAEAKAAAALEHPHIGVIHEIDDSSGVFIAMELFRGHSLATRIEQGLSVSEALELGIGIASGLAHAHERGIIHRDLKPANVMLTETGHPKIIDFGLAKLLDSEQSPFLRDAGEEESPLFAGTREGYVAGTVSFMSPEQARGGKVDGRSDVFSFGLLLFTMLAGQPPFEGTSRIDTLHAILREPTPKLPLGPDARQYLQPVIERCLAKEPDARYQSMKEVLEALKTARVQIEASNMGLRGLKRFAAAAALVVAGAALALFALFVAGGESPEAGAEKPSIAVLHFENLSGDPELDWLRTGLTELLVTDLSQSKEVEILSTERLYQILEDLDLPNASALTTSDIEDLARRGGVDTVLLGSYAKAGDAIRLSARIESAESGDVLFTETAEAVGESNVFRLVDELTEKIKTDLGLEVPPQELDRDLRDVTTASLEAYREYAEGIRLHERFREEEAIPHFERAVELDPGFAMALAKLGVVQNNLGLNEQADANAERALQHIDRLSERERYYIEGWAYSRHPETLDRAIEAYEKAIDLYPDHGSARHNLANLMFEIERYDEAIEQFEELRRRRMLFPATYEQLAQAYKAEGNVDAARRVLTEFSARNPDDWTTLLALAQLDIETGEIDRGLETLGRAKALGAGAVRTAPVAWEASVFREEWAKAEETARTLMGGSDTLERFIGGRLVATTLLYRGRMQSVIDVLEGLELRGDGRDFASQAALFEARALLEVGDYQRARAKALETETTGKPYGNERERSAIIAIASARLGETEEADRWIRVFRELPAVLGQGDERTREFVEGELALVRRDYDEAIAHLNEAESLLPPRGVEGSHALIWYSLATAHREAGNTSEAVSWYERILESRQERVFEPIRYVRSFYYLAELLEQEGDEEGAQHLYERFLEYWRDGDLDRDLVAGARAKLS